MKRFLQPFLIVAALVMCAVAFMSADKVADNDITVASPSVALFTPITAVDSASAHTFTWTDNALKKGTVYWLLDFEKAVTDSAATMVITIEQSAQTAPLRGVTQRWYTTDTIAVLSGKVATPQRWYKDTYSHALAGREIRLKVVSTDNHNLTSGKVDLLYKPDF